MKTRFLKVYLNFQEVKQSEEHSRKAEPRLEELPLSYIYMYIYVLIYICIYMYIYISPI